jgi:pimeloyl-ACP methyl ester carboxylesterase
LRAALLFARPRLAPPEWLAEQRRLARAPGFLEATLSTLRAQVSPGGQREVSLKDLRILRTPTLVIWGAHDRVFPRRQAKEAPNSLENGSLVVIPECGHLPQIERPDRFADALDWFLEEVERLTDGAE